LKKLHKIFSVAVLSFILFFATTVNNAFAEDSGTFNYEILKYNTNDTSIANDYFNKPAKYVKKNGKLYVQITVNHSHWITGMSIEGHKEKIINKNAAKDERTSEFEVSKVSGKVQGKIDVYINEKVNGKPFLYDHHYNITYKFNGPSNVVGNGSSSASTTGNDTTGGTTNTGTGGVENPQTSAGIPGYIYIVPAVALMLFVFITFYAKKVNKGNVK